MSRTRVGSIVAGICITALGAAVAPALAAPPKQFLANINAGQETPPTPSGALGVGHFTYDQLTKMLCFSISFTPLIAPELSAHIHGPAAPGTPAGIVFPLPLGNPKSGCVGPLDSTQKAQLFSNLFYVNIHSTDPCCGAGEIRGQMLRIK